MKYIKRVKGTGKGSLRKEAERLWLEWGVVFFGTSYRRFKVRVSTLRWIQRVAEEITVWGGLGEEAKGKEKEGRGKRGEREKKRQTHGPVLPFMDAISSKVEQKAVRGCWFALSLRSACPRPIFLSFFFLTLWVVMSVPLLPKKRKEKKRVQGDLLKAVCLAGYKGMKSLAQPTNHEPPLLTRWSATNMATMPINQKPKIFNHREPKKRAAI